MVPKLLVVAVASAALLANCTATPPPPSPSSEVSVATVIDGDTVRLRDGRAMRLLGIDAPELGRDGRPEECGATAAKTRLTALTKSPVRLVTDPAADSIDRYGRTLAYLDAGGDDIGATLLTEGLAAAWQPLSTPPASRITTYRDLTATARATRTGSWAHCPRLGR